MFWGKPELRVWELPDGDADLLDLGGAQLPTGMALDPNFATNRWIYLYYSRNAYRNWVWDYDLGKYIEDGARSGDRASLETRIAEYVEYLSKVQIAYE